MGLKVSVFYLNVITFFLGVCLVLGCDDQRSASTTMNELTDQGIQNNQDLDQNLEMTSDGRVDDLIEDAEITSDTFVEFSFTACSSLEIGRISADNNQFLLTSESEELHAQLSWPAESLIYQTLVDNLIREQEPVAEQWPEVELSCQDFDNWLDESERIHRQVENPDRFSILKLSQAISITPLLSEQVEYWRWQKPATLSFIIDSQVPNDVMLFENVELWWWPYQPNSVGDPFDKPQRILLRNPKWNEDDRHFSVSIDEWGAYMLVMRVGNVEEETEEPPTYRAIIGVSMGGGASAHISARNPEKFDFVAALGGPSDWLYMLNYVTNRLLGGFCTGEDLGTFCGTGAVTEPMEQYADFHNFIYATNGVDFTRDQYLKIFQDVVFALGNPTSYHPQSSYLGAGLPIDELYKSRRERCRMECRGPDCDLPSEWLKLSSVYDVEFNPTGDAGYSDL